MDEFALIHRYFAQPAAQLAQTSQGAVVQGIGDDCALLQPAAGMQLALSCDTLNEGRHFLPGTDARRLGHKALAVNLSDLAACGAAPLGFTLALSLPAIDEAWLQEFSAGLLALATAHHCPLVGGDTTRGPLAIHITAFGQVPPGQALLRSGARVGDRIYVSGAVGEARAGLHLLQGTLAAQDVADAALRQHLIARLEAPSPRLALGQRLRGVASSALDLSDGLLGDIGHILQASGVGAHIDGPALLASAPRLWGAGALDHWSEAQQLEFALAGGDDYELLFTAAPEHHAHILALAEESDTAVHAIGHITEGQALQVVTRSGERLQPRASSFNHFASNG